MSSRTSILAWPPAVRQIVYEQLGLATGRMFVVPAKSDRMTGHLLSEDIFRLLQVCKTIYHEVSEVLYARNKFHVRIETSSDLNFLRQLKPSTISKLRDLVICVNSTSCRICNIGADPHQSSLPNDDQRRLDENESMSTQIRSTQSDWQIALSYVLSHVSPGSLNFTLICDVADHNIISQVLSPLQTEGLALGGCSIRLARLHDADLNKLAKRTAQKTLQETSKSTPFRFLDLPTEIRLLVLKYTDLVTPLKEVYWNEKDNYSVFFLNTCDSNNGCLQDERFHYACQFRLCQQGFRCRSSPVSDYIRDPESLEDQRLLGCYNRYELTDHLPDGWECRCWAPPTALFLVCQHLHREAEAIFFQENRFVLTSVDGFCEQPVTNLAQFGAATFLDRLRPSAAKYLRMLEIVFPPFEPDDCPPESKILSHWDRALKCAGDKLSLSNLTLRIYMADHLDMDWEQENLPDFRKHMTHEDGNKLIEIYKRILAPLARLSGLGELFLHLSWPWQWVARQTMEWHEGKEFCEAESKILEDSIGESVFGRDEYSRATSHKNAHVDSQWLQWANSDFYI